jgi:2'-5' RNA ligase
VRFTRPEGLHLTLAFLGETAEERLSALRNVLDAATSESRPISLEVDGLGVFPDARRPRVVWAGLAGDLTRLTELHDRLRRELMAEGFQAEDRPFRPHVTLGRATGQGRPEALRALRDRLSRQRQPGQAQEHYGAWRAGALDLMLSELRREGARYTTLYSSRFRGAEPHP